MKSRSLLIVAASLAAFLCFAATYSVAQIGGGFGGGGQFGNNRTSGLELIDDLPKAVPKEAGRFQIVTLINHTLLLDTKSGDTWVLTENPKQEGSLSWVEVPRVRQKPKPEDAEPDPDDKPKPRADVDPFG